MKNAPFFSIVTPTYNRGDIILDSLNSVLNEARQAKISVEVIVVDDHSSDNTEFVIRDWADVNKVDWVRYFYLESRTGVTGARNFGIDQAQGKYLIFLDSDDQLLLGAFQRFKMLFEGHPEIDMIWGPIQLKSGKKVPERKDITNKVIGYGEYLKSGSISEHIPVLRRVSLESPTVRFESALNGFEGILYARMLRRGSKMWIDSIPVRLYDDLRIDRYCHISNLEKDSNRLLHGSFHYAQEFGADIKALAPRVFDRMLSRVVFYYKINGSSFPLIYSYIKGNLSSSTRMSWLIDLTPAVVLRAAYRLLWLLRAKSFS